MGAYGGRRSKVPKQSVVRRGDRHLGLLVPGHFEHVPLEAGDQRLDRDAARGGVARLDSLELGHAGGERGGHGEGEELAEALGGGHGRTLIAAVH